MPTRKFIVTQSSVSGRQKMDNLFFIMEVIKKIEERANALFIEQEQKGFANLSQDDLNDVTTSLQEILKELEMYLSREDMSEQEEIYCFKMVKPTIVGRTMFFHRLMIFDSSYLASSNDCHIAFYDSVRSEIREYIAANRTIFYYYKRGTTTLDSIYFVRNHNNHDGDWMNISSDCYSPFSTIHDKTFANFICFGLLNDFISDKMTGLEQGSDSSPQGLKQGLLTWTGTQVSMVELGYALYASGVINRGTATLKEIMDALSIAFSKDLGNYYRAFADVKNRGGGSTTFLDSLKANLVKMIDSEQE